MKKLLLISLVIFLVSGFAYAKELVTTKQAGPYAVTITLDKNPPIVGDNNLSLTIKDASGKIIKDAKVSVDYEMPAMPGMPAMRYKVQPTLKGDAYVGKVNFSMGGAWNLNVKITEAGKSFMVKMNVDVS
jgi:hypothetical protein